MNKCTMLLRYGLPALLTGLVTSVIVINALWLQKGRHPAPLFLSSRQDVPLSPVRSSTFLSRGISPDLNELSAEPSDAQRSVLKDLQVVLGMLGFYDGPLDGLYDSRMRAALSAYQKAKGLSSIRAAYENLLRRVSGNPGEVASRHSTDATRIPLTHERITTLQRMLARLGYAPGRIDGLLGQETRNAIRNFERDRNLKVTGAFSVEMIEELHRVSRSFVESRSGI